MIPKPLSLSLRYARKLCCTHSAALQEAVVDIRERQLAGNLDDLSKDDRRLLDQFAYRFTRLQDDLGARLMPSVLRALGEDVAGMAVLDRLNRLEQLGWIPSAEGWITLRQIRNAFTHDYPDTAEERTERLRSALDAAQELMELDTAFNKRISDNFPNLDHDNP